jgi:VanZ family protein
VTSLDRERVARPPVPMRMRATARIVSWGPVLAWMLVIFLLSGDQFSDAATSTWIADLSWVGALGLSPPVIAVANFMLRKCAHFVEYAVLGMLCLRAVGATWRLGGRERLAIAVALAAAYASVDELHQYAATRFRTGTARDVALDVAGAFAGALVGAIYAARRRPAA